MRLRLWLALALSLCATTNGAIDPTRTRFNVTETFEWLAVTIYTYDSSGTAVTTGGEIFDVRVEGTNVKQWVSSAKGYPNFWNYKLYGAPACSNICFEQCDAWAAYSDSTSLDQDKLGVNVTYAFPMTVNSIQAFEYSMPQFIEDMTLQYESSSKLIKANVSFERCPNDVYAPVTFSVSPPFLMQSIRIRTVLEPYSSSSTFYVSLLGAVAIFGNINQSNPVLDRNDGSYVVNITKSVDLVGSLSVNTYYNGNLLPGNIGFSMGQNTICANAVTIQRRQEIRGSFFNATRHNFTCDGVRFSRQGHWYTSPGTGRGSLVRFYNDYYKTSPNFFVFESKTGSCNDLVCRSYTGDVNFLSAVGAFPWFEEEGSKMYYFVTEGQLYDSSSPTVNTGARYEFAILDNEHLSNDVCEHATALDASNGFTATGSTARAVFDELPKCARDQSSSTSTSSSSSSDTDSTTGSSPDIYGSRGVFYSVVGTGSSMNLELCLGYSDEPTVATDTDPFDSPSRIAWTSQSQTRRFHSLKVLGGNCGDFSCIRAPHVQGLCELGDLFTYTFNSTLNAKYYIHVRYQNQANFTISGLQKVKNNTCVSADLRFVNGTQIVGEKPCEWSLPAPLPNQLIKISVSQIDMIEAEESFIINAGCPISTEPFFFAAFSNIGPNYYTLSGTSIPDDFYFPVSVSIELVQKKRTKIVITATVEYVPYSADKLYATEQAWGHIFPVTSSFSCEDLNPRNPVGAIATIGSEWIVIVSSQDYEPMTYIVSTSGDRSINNFDNPLYGLNSTGMPILPNDPLQTFVTAQFISLETGQIQSKSVTPADQIFPPEKWEQQSIYRSYFEWGQYAWTASESYLYFLGGCARAVCYAEVDKDPKNKNIGNFGEADMVTPDLSYLWKMRLTGPEDTVMQSIKLSAYVVPRVSQTITFYNDFIVLFGGYSPVSKRNFNDVVLINSTDGYITTPKIVINLPPVRESHTAVIYKDQLIVFGGRTRTQEINPSYTFKIDGALINSLNDVWVLDLKSMTWENKTDPSSIMTPRFGHNAIVYKDKMFVIGGDLDTRKVYRHAWYDRDSYYTDVWALDLGKFTWTRTTPKGATGNAWNAASVLLGSNIVTYGGYVARPLYPTQDYAETGPYSVFTRSSDWTTEQTQESLTTYNKVPDRFDRIMMNFYLPASKDIYGPDNYPFMYYKFPKYYTIEPVCLVNNASLAPDGCLPCAPGSSIITTKAGQICSPCPVGTYGDIFERELCRPCPTGSYQDEPGRTVCKSCLAGFYNRNSRSNTSEDCLPCPFGQFNNKTGSSSCTACPAGQTCVLGSSVPFAKNFFENEAMIRSSEESFSTIDSANYPLKNDNYLFLFLGAVVIAIVFSVLIFWKRQARSVLRYDLLQESDFPVPGPVLKSKTWIGTALTFTVVLVVIAIAINVLLTYLYLNYILIAGIVPGALLTDVAAKHMEVTLNFYGFEGTCLVGNACNPGFSALTKGLSQSGSLECQMPNAYTCSLHWLSKTKYNQISSSSEVLFTLDSRFVAAREISWYVATDSVYGGDMYSYSSGALLPSENDTLIRGGATPSVIQISVIPSKFTNKKGETTTGLTCEFLSRLIPDSNLVNATTFFDAKDEIAVSVQFIVSPFVYEKNAVMRLSGFTAVANAVALIGGVITVARLIALFSLTRLKKVKAVRNSIRLDSSANF